MTAATAPVRSPRREATRARLLAAATQAFAERGFYGTSVEDICERAGFTRGAFYSNFASREELVIALAEQRSARMRDRVGELTSSGEQLSPTDLLHGVLDLWDDPDERHRWLLLQTEFTLHALRDPAAGAAWAQHLGRTLADITDLLQGYAERTGIELPVEMAELARLLHAVFLGGAAQTLVCAPDGRGPEESLVTLVEQVIAR